MLEHSDADRRHRDHGPAWRWHRLGADEQLIDCIRPGRLLGGGVRVARRPEQVGARDEGDCDDRQPGGDHMTAKRPFWHGDIAARD
jgi:hypothetical protein